MLLSWFTAEIHSNSSFGFWMRFLWSTGCRRNANPFCMAPAAYRLPAEEHRRCMFYNSILWILYFWKMTTDKVCPKQQRRQIHSYSLLTYVCEQPTEINLSMKHSWVFFMLLGKTPLWIVVWYYSGLREVARFCKASQGFIRI